MCVHIFCGSQRVTCESPCSLSSSFQGSNAGFQAWQKVRLAAEPSHWPRFKYFSSVLRLNCKRLMGHFIFTSQNQNDVALGVEKAEFPEPPRKKDNGLTHCLPDLTKVSWNFGECRARFSACAVFSKVQMFSSWLGLLSGLSTSSLSVL